MRSIPSPTIASVAPIPHSNLIVDAELVPPEVDVEVVGLGVAVPAVDSALLSADVSLCVTEGVCVVIGSVTLGSADEVEMASEFARISWNEGNGTPTAEHTVFAYCSVSC